MRLLLPRRLPALLVALLGTGDARASPAAGQHGGDAGGERGVRGAGPKEEDGVVPPEEDFDGQILVCVEGPDRQALERARGDDLLGTDEDVFASSSAAMKSIAGAKVVCSEQLDLTTELMGEARTDDTGCATVAYDTRRVFHWVGTPAIECTVLARGYHPKDTAPAYDVDAHEHAMDKTTLTLGTEDAQGLGACDAGALGPFLFGMVLPTSFQAACAEHARCYDTCNIYKTKLKCDYAQYDRHYQADPTLALVVLHALHDAENVYDAAQATACAPPPSSDSPTTSPTLVGTLPPRPTPSALGGATKGIANQEAEAVAALVSK